MARRSRRNHSATFKAKVALEALPEHLTLAELAKKHDVHPNQITDWKKQLVAVSAGTFDRGAGKSEPEPVDLKGFHAKIGRQALEINFVSGVLAKAGLLSAKR